MKIQVLVLMLIGFILSSCSTKQVEPRVKYIKNEKFEFQKVDTKGVYIELDKHDRKRCTKYLLELNEIYNGILDFYNYQIDEYNKLFDKNISK